VLPERAASSDDPSAAAERKQGLTLAKGQFVMTGTTTGIHTPELGQHAVADFGDLRKVEITFV